MKIFMISPVRNIDISFLHGVGDEVQALEAQGHHVYWPLRDTPQERSETDICLRNSCEMSGSDAVYVCWDGESQGCLFDLGMAYAWGKKIVPVVGMVPRMTAGKSFANLIHALAELN